MYESFYGLREKPFSLTPDPEYLYLSEAHRLGLAMLEYALEGEAGFTVLTGEVGSGKTLLVRCLMERLDPWVGIGLISNTHQAFGSLLEWVLREFEIPYEGKSNAKRHQDFADFLVSEYAEGRKVLLIVDEAQNLSNHGLEELRVLSNINAGKDTILQTILVGQPELRTTLQRHDMRQFAQRIVADYHLPGLGRKDSRAYVQHRIRVAGGSPQLFESDALDLMHDASQGIPRLANNLCDRALVYGFAEQMPTVSADLMRVVIEERSFGMPRAVNGHSAHTTDAAGVS
jgi:type II secretory pathway predicted ATPase ExeA